MWHQAKEPGGLSLAEPPGFVRLVCSTTSMLVRSWFCFLGYSPYGSANNNDIAPLQTPAKNAQPCQPHIHNPPTALASSTIPLAVTSGNKRSIQPSTLLSPIDEGASYRTFKRMECDSDNWEMILSNSSHPSYAASPIILPGLAESEKSKPGVKSR